MTLLGSNTCCRSSGSETPPWSRCHLHPTARWGHSQAPPAVLTLWNSFAKPSTEWGQRRRHTEKILFPWGLEVRDGSCWWGCLHMVTPVCDTGTVLKPSLCEAVRFSSPLHNTKVACFQYWQCHSKKSGEIHHSPWGYSGVTSSPCTSFFRRAAQPLQLHFCAAQRQWLQAKLGGLFCSPTAQDLYAQVQIWICTCKYNIHTVILCSFPLRSSIFLLSNSLPTTCLSTDTQTFSSKAEKMKNLLSHTPMEHTQHTLICTHLGNTNSSSLLKFCCHNDFADNFAYWTCFMVGVTTSNSSPAPRSRVTCWDCSYAIQTL